MRHFCLSPSIIFNSLALKKMVNTAQRWQAISDTNRFGPFVFPAISISTNCQALQTIVFANSRLRTEGDTHLLTAERTGRSERVCELWPAR